MLTPKRDISLSPAKTILFSEEPRPIRADSVGTKQYGSRLEGRWIFLSSAAVTSITKLGKMILDWLTIGGDCRRESTRNLGRTIRNTANNRNGGPESPKSVGKTADQMDGWSKKNGRELDARGSGQVLLEKGRPMINSGRDWLRTRWWRLRILCLGSNRTGAGLEPWRWQSYHKFYLFWGNRPISRILTFVFQKRW